MKKNKMNYGKENQLTDEDLDMKNAKVRITTFIDKAVYDALKADAEANPGKKYQTILNDLLVEHYFAPKREKLSKFKDPIQNEIGLIKKRLAALEKEKTG
jgi:uncharacterized protein (DUF4415 family)